MRWGCLLVALVLVPLASAHVGYVLDHPAVEANQGADLVFLAGAFQPTYIGMMLATILVTGLLLWWLSRNNESVRRMRRIVRQASRYGPFIPWIARLGVGIALIGAGSAGVMISPAVSTPWPWFSTVEVLVGFLILAGFLTSLAAWAALILFLITLLHASYLVGNLDFLALVLSILVLGSSRPGIDDLFSIPFLAPLTKLRASVPLLLRLGIGLGMTYLALFEKLLNPNLSRIVVEQYSLTSVIPVSSSMWVFSAGVIELAVGLFLLLGVLTRATVAVAFLVLSLSFFYFGEAVYSHITLFATLSILFVTGGGSVSLDSWWSSRKKPI